MKSIMSRWIIRLIVIVVIIGALIGIYAWYKLFRQVPLHYANVEDQFKYGSIGTEDSSGIPYWIFMVMPRLFPEYLPGPGGYSSFGFAWEEGHELPIGFTKKTIGFERVGINCAFCHTARVRREGEAVPRIYLGGPGNAVDILGYQRFLFACASDPRFTASHILDEIGAITRLSFLDRLVYRFILIPATRKTLLKQKEMWAWASTRPYWGRGRIDPFNPI